MTTKYVYFYDNNILLYTFEKFRVNLNSRYFFSNINNNNNNINNNCASLTPAVDIDGTIFSKSHQIAIFELFAINRYKCIQTYRYDNYM